MKSIQSLVALCITVTFLPLLDSHAATPSSVIPTRREFPVAEEVAPCQNFYQHACKKVNESFALREDRSRHTFSFSDSSERILEYKKEYFKKLGDLKTARGKEKMLRNVYLACMNPTTRAQEEKDHIAQVSGQMKNIKDREELLTYFAKRILSPDFSPASFGVDSNLDRPEYQDVFLATSMRSLPERSYYEKPELVSELKALMKEFYDIVGDAESAKRAEALFNFEAALTKAHPLPHELRVLFTERKIISREELVKQLPALKLQGFLKEIPKHTVFRDIFGDELKVLNTKLAEMPLEDLKAIYLYFSLDDELDDAYPEFYQKKFAFNQKHLGGPAKRPERQERCTRLVMNGFNKELDSILWERFFPNFPKGKVVALAERIRKTLIETLKKNQWLSKTAKAKAIEKMTKAELKLVAPASVEAWDFNIPGEYSETKPLENSRIYSMLANKKALKDLAGPISKKRWHMGPMTVNAYYDPSFNQFVLPAGILQYPFFDPQMSDEANLGAMGSVVGHELGHGIDDQGSKFDSKGKLNQWMTDADLTEFKKRGASLVTQFAAIGHNGELTLGENIGDLVGLGTSYRAAFDGKKFLNDKEEKQKKQEFFLQWARTWCDVERPSMTERRLKTDPHALGYARTNEQVKLQAGFSEAFGCSASDPMSLKPKDRTEIW